MKAYLYKAIINEVADTKRLIRNYHNCINEYVERNNHPRSPKAPAKIVMELDEANRMFEFIEEQLTHTEAQAICLRYRDDLSTKKIAEKMSVRSVTVRGYIHAGLNRIRGLLRDIAAYELE